MVTPPPLVLGFERFDDYLAHSRYFGATARRCANRIARRRSRWTDKTTGLTRTSWASTSFMAAAPVSASAFGAEGVKGRTVPPCALTWRIARWVIPARWRCRCALARRGAGYRRIDATAGRPTLCNLARTATGTFRARRTSPGPPFARSGRSLPAGRCGTDPTGEVAPVGLTAFDFRSVEGWAMPAVRRGSTTTCVFRRRA